MRVSGLLLLLLVLSTAQAQVRVIVVDPPAGRLTLRATDDVDLGRLALITRSTEFRFAQPPNATHTYPLVEFVAPSGVLNASASLNVTGLPFGFQLGGDVSVLYVTHPYWNGTGPNRTRIETNATLIDYVQWRVAGQPGEAWAVREVLWAAGDAVQGHAPLTFTGDEDDFGASFWVAPQANFVFSTTSMDFGDVRLDRPGELDWRPLTITNTGAAPGCLSQFKVLNTATDEFVVQINSSVLPVNANVQPGSSVQGRVAFVPHTLGARQGSIHAHGTTISLVANVVRHNPRLSSMSCWFGSIDANLAEGSWPQCTITVENNGTASMEVTHAAILSNAAFQLMPSVPDFDAVNVTLSGGASLSLPMLFNLSRTNITGNHSAELSVLINGGRTTLTAQLTVHVFERGLKLSRYSTSAREISVTNYGLVPRHLAAYALVSTYQYHRVLSELQVLDITSGSSSSMLMPGHTVTFNTSYIDERVHISNVTEYANVTVFFNETVINATANTNETVLMNRTELQSFQNITRTNYTVLFSLAGPDIALYRDGVVDYMQVGAITHANTSRAEAADAQGLWTLGTFLPAGESPFTYLGDGLQTKVTAWRSRRPIFDLSATSHEFADRHISDTPSSLVSIEISNSGDGPLVFDPEPSVTTLSGDRNALVLGLPSLSPLAAGAAARSLQVSFNPSSPGFYSFRISLYTNDPATPTRHVVINGTGIHSQLDVQFNEPDGEVQTFPSTTVQGTMQLGETPLGLGITGTIRFKNSGQAPLNLTSVALVQNGGAPPQFTLSDNLNPTVLAGMSHLDVAVTLTADAAATFTVGAIAAFSDDLNFPSGEADFFFAFATGTGSDEYGVRMTSIDIDAGTVLLRNYGGLTVDMRTHAFTSGSANAPVTSMTVVSGSLSLAGGGLLLLDVSAVLNLTKSGADLALYNSTTRFSDQTLLVDFVQWGSFDMNTGKQSQAAVRGLWPLDASISPDTSPYLFLGSALQRGPDYWVGNFPLLRVKDTVLGAAPSVWFGKSPMDYPGQARVQRTFELSSIGVEDVVVDAIRIEGTDAASFNLSSVSQSLPAVLPSSAEMEVDVETVITSPGIKNATLKVYARHANVSIALSTLGTLPELQTDTQVLEFGRIDLTSCPPQGVAASFTVGNSGNAPLRLLNIQLTGSAFSLDSLAAVQNTFAPSESREIGITFQATEPGYYEATLSADLNVPGNNVTWMFSATATHTGLRIVRVDPANSAVVLRNMNQHSAISLNNLMLVSGAVATRISAGDFWVDSGESLMCFSGGEVTLRATAESSFSIGLTAGSLALLVADDDATRADLLIDYLQWGSAATTGPGAQAAARGLWPSGEFVDGESPFTFTGQLEDVGPAFWRRASGALTLLGLTEFDFGSVTVESTRDILVGNSGEGSLGLSLSVAPVDGVAIFKLVSASSLVVARGADPKAVQVAFAPTKHGLQQGALVMTYTDYSAGNTGQTATMSLPLRGTGTPCAGNPCLNDGTCVVNGTLVDEFICECRFGFSGVICATSSGTAFAQVLVFRLIGAYPQTPAIEGRLVLGVAVDIAASLGISRSRLSLTIQNVNNVAVFTLTIFPPPLGSPPGTPSSALLADRFTSMATNTSSPLLLQTRTSLINSTSPVRTTSQSVEYCDDGTWQSDCPTEPPFDPIQTFTLAAGIGFLALSCGAAGVWAILRYYRKQEEEEKASGMTRVMTEEELIEGVQMADLEPEPTHEAMLQRTSSRRMLRRKSSRRLSRTGTSRSMTRRMSKRSMSRRSMSKRSMSKRSLDGEV